MAKTLFKRFGAFFLLTMAFACVSFAQSDEVVRVRFAKWKTAKTISYAVLRDESITYVVKAKKGQKLSVKVTAIEKNAAFMIEGPSGNFLSGAGEMDDQTIWNGTLTETGDYRIEIGSTRGNANFRLTISIN